MLVEIDRRWKMKNSKMYICVKESVPLGVAMTAVGHAVAASYEKWSELESFRAWARESFKKVVCRVSESEFEKLKTQDDYIEMTESSLNGEPTALVFLPREVIPKMFKFLRLYR